MLYLSILYEATIALLDISLRETLYLGVLFIIALFLTKVSHGLSVYQEENEEIVIGAY